MSQLRGRLVSFLLAGSVLAAGVGSLAGCGNDNDDGEAFPNRPYIGADGHSYCVWVDDPQECAWSQWPPAPFPVDMNDDDSDMLFYYMSYNSFYSGPTYYHRHMRGHTMVSHNTYYSNVNTFNKRHDAKIKTYTKKAEYRAPDGKVYKGNTAPKKYFAGTNSKKEKTNWSSVSKGYKSPSVKGPSSSGFSSRSSGRR